VLIAIDDSSLDALGAFPWPRRHYAELLQRLQAAPPQTIVFDILMSDASPDDPLLAEAIAAHSAVILASAWDREGRPIKPTATLAKAALGSGHIMQYHQGWNIHHVKPVIHGEPALSIATAQAISLTQREIQLPSLDLPLWVNWPSTSRQLGTYSFVDVLQGRVDPQVFRNKIVLVGATAIGLDDWVSPFDVTPPASGVHLHAALINNLLNRGWLVPVTGSWFGMLVLGLGITYWLPKYTLGQQAGIAGGCLILWWGLAVGLLNANLWLPVVEPGLFLVTLSSLTISRQVLQQNRWSKCLVESLKRQYFQDLTSPQVNLLDGVSHQEFVLFEAEDQSTIAQLLQLTQQLGRSQTIQTAITRSLPIGLVVVAMDGTVWVTNPIAARWLSLAVGDNLAATLVPDWLSESIWEECWQVATQSHGHFTQVLQRGETWYELRLDPLASDAHLPDAWPQGAILLIEDISYRRTIETQLRFLNHGLETQVQVRTAQLEEFNRTLQRQIAERQQAQKQLIYEALHDPLTGLPNRRQFLLKLSQQLEGAKQGLFAVLFLDCDRFKLINHSFGHWVGDDLLKQVAATVQDCLRPTDIMARFGGDEFAVLLVNLEQTSDAVTIAQAIRQHFTNSFQVGEHQLFTSVSIGIVVGDQPYSNPNDVLRDADTAMYQAKANGLGYAIFDPGMHLDVRRSLQIETALRLAVERQEFQLYYQPIFSLKTCQLIGCEALLRWLHPEHGMIAPDEFVPVAEDTGLMVSLGQWVMREACQQMQCWRRCSLMPSEAMISINLSATQFLQPDLIVQINQILQESTLPSANLKLEITETVVIQNPQQVIEIIETLRDQGIRLSIDDFGMGYSSLSYLQQLPVSMLKIDRSFINDIHQSSQQYGITEAIINLAAHLDIQVIAEGIEQPDQLQCLKQLGCQFGQGYIFARPLNVSQFTQYLRKMPESTKTNQLKPC
jgi:diguanylate cyclase (GGDEF)-like protein